MATSHAGAGPDRDAPGSEAESGSGRSGSFRVTIFSLLAFMLLYLTSVEAVEGLLDTHFRGQVGEAVQVSPTAGPIVTQIRQRVGRRIHGSPWVRYGGARINVTVLGSDGLTPLYVGGSLVVPAPPLRELDVAMWEAIDVLPAIYDVFVSVPHGSPLSAGLLVGYGAILLQGLFLYTRRVARIERARLEAAVASRDRSAERARSIEAELAGVQERLRAAEPAERQQSKEIEQLERERSELRAKLRELGRREAELSASASRARELEEERQALEDLLDEAMEDVSAKDGAIHELEDQLKHASRKQSSGGRSRSREGERIAKRLRTLYKNLEVDERAVTDLAGLGDESLKLRAEEGLKRLDDDPETASVRRKVGGLPPQLAIFEVGYAGKGRIYFTRNQRGAYRVLAIGGKASQKQDLEYLSRLDP